MYDYTKDVLLKLKRLDLLPEMVQVGNEITNGLMWPHGKWDNVDNIARFISAGIRAVREVSPDSRVMLHLDCGGNNARCRNGLMPMYREERTSMSSDCPIILSGMEPLRI